MVRFFRHNVYFLIRLLPNAFVIAVINDVDVEITEIIRMAAAAGCGVGGYHDMKVK